MWRRLCRDDKGFTLLEVLVVVLVLGILGTVGAASVSGLVSDSRTKSLQTQLATLQSGVDSFYAKQSSFPTAAQPASGAPKQLSLTATDGDSKKFYPSYVTVEPTATGSTYGLSGTLYYGVTVAGRVFASTTAPASWAGTTTVYIQENTGNTATVADIE